MSRLRSGEEWKSRVSIIRYSDRSVVLSEPLTEICRSSSRSSSLTVAAGPVSGMSCAVRCCDLLPGTGCAHSSGQCYASSSTRRIGCTCCRQNFSDRSPIFSRCASSYFTLRSSGPRLPTLSPVRGTHLPSDSHRNASCRMSET